jgi:hypothetical protein
MTLSESEIIRLLEKNEKYIYWFQVMNLSFLRVLFCVAKKNKPAQNIEKSKRPNPYHQKRRFVFRLVIAPDEIDMAPRTSQEKLQKHRTSPVGGVQAQNTYGALAGKEKDTVPIPCVFILIYAFVFFSIFRKVFTLCL